MGRIEKALTSAGVPHRVLDADGLRDALTYACGLESLGQVTAVGSLAAQESWAAWRAGGLSHVTFTVPDWPKDPSPDLLAKLSLIPAFAVSVAIALRSHGDRVALLGLIRVVAPPARMRAAIHQLGKTADGFGMRLRRLDGDQARAAYATAPTGVGGIW
jgi:type VII secretion protein EccE